MSYTLAVTVPPNPATARGDGQLALCFLDSRMSSPTTNTAPPAVHSTTIASGSNSVALPATPINVVATAGFDAAGNIWITIGGIPRYVTYTSLTGTTFAGAAGGAGTMLTGQTVVGGDDGGGVQTVTNTQVTFTTQTYDAFDVMYWDPADTTNSGVPNLYWLA